MKVLVISHTYITRVGREKWRELQRLFGVELKIIVPSKWRDYLFTLRYADHADDELAMHPRHVFFSGKESAHFYANVGFFLRSFSPDVLHVEEGTDALSFAQALTVKRFLSPRTKSLFFTWMNWKKALRFPFTMIERYNLTHSDAAIAGNADARDILIEKGFAKPIHVLPLLGIDPALFSPSDQSALRRELALDHPTIGFIGRFVPEKGVLDLIDAAARLAFEYNLLFVGGGALEEEMRARARHHGIEHRMRIVKSVPHGDVPKYLNCMDALVLPSYTVSHWKEQFGQVLVQAMACGVPVVGSAHAEIPRVIGDAGLIIPERMETTAAQTIDALASALERIIRDNEVRTVLKEKGRQRVLNNYTNTKIAEETFRIYQSLARS